MSDETNLEGASEMPAPMNAELTTETFAQRWNSLELKERAEWLESLHADSRWAHRCFIENHDGRLAELLNIPKLPVAEDSADVTLAGAGVSLGASVDGRRVRELVILAIEHDRELRRG